MDDYAILSSGISQPTYNTTFSNTKQKYSTLQNQKRSILLSEKGQPCENRLDCHQNLECIKPDSKLSGTCGDWIPTNDKYSTRILDPAISNPSVPKLLQSDFYQRMYSPPQFPVAYFREPTTKEGFGLTNLAEYQNVTVDPDYRRKGSDDKQAMYTSKMKARPGKNYWM